MFITEDRFVTGAGWLYSQANSHRLGPFDLVQVVPAYMKGVIVLSQGNICGLEFICAGCTESVRLSQTISQVSHKCLKVLETKRNCYLH